MGVCESFKCQSWYLIPSAVVLTGEVWGRSLGHKCKTLMNEEAGVILLIFDLWVSEGTIFEESKRSPASDILVFPAFKTVRDRYLILTISKQRYFV